MHTLIRPLFTAATYRGWAHALAGAALSVPPLTTAVLSAPPRWPLPARIAGFTLALVVVVTALGAPRAARGGSVRLANLLLGTGLPLPATEPPRSWSQWANRLRTAGWLVPHVAVGMAVTAVTGLLVFGAVMFPAVWWSGGGEVAFFGGRITVPAGGQGLWTPLVLVAFLLLAVHTVAVGTAALRLLAPAFLDHRPADRLAAAEERMNLLAERNRLAQELHDSIGHTLTASTIQAAVAGELLERDPVAARQAITSIEETSRAAMDDLDHVLGALRDERASKAPQRTLADLDALVESVRRAGAEVRWECGGDLGRIPAAVSREAYRIVQEGLTNALRYGEKTGIRLRVEVRRKRLEVELVNRIRPGGDGPADRGGTRSGQGLRGITERVRLLRGEVSSGPVTDETSDGGAAGAESWRLRARLPLGSGR
ncbi:histidine kinase [Streptomyces sp. NPDC048636]|uniref:sensor histidine kinase n=1 Tax=Streptomyces sp. NPDC048636 TaxID=3155762 RepID=UPI00343772CC